MNDGSAITNGRASSVADAGPMLSRSTTARRVGSDSAWNTVANDGSIGEC
jgi:hypothetical protein